MQISIVTISIVTISIVTINIGKGMKAAGEIVNLAVSFNHCKKVDLNLSNYTFRSI